VIEQGGSQELAHLLQPPGQPPVLRRWGGIAGGVVVREEHSRGITTHRRSEDQEGIGDGAALSATAEALKGQRMEGPIEVERMELFMGEILQAAAEPCPGQVGGVDGMAGGRAGLGDPPACCEPGVDADRTGWSDPGDLAECRDRCMCHATKATEPIEDRARHGEGRQGAARCAEHQREELLVAETLRAEDCVGFPGAHGTSQESFSKPCANEKSMTYRSTCRRSTKV